MSKTSSVRRIFKSSLLPLLCGLGVAVRQKGVPILTYHSVDESGSLLSVSTKLFRSQMEFMHVQGYRTISLKDLFDALDDDRPLPDRSVVLTFDDGFHNNFATVTPILQRFGFRATLFLATGYVGDRMRWTKTDDVPELKMADWSEIRQMSNSTWDIEAHTKTHPNLTHVSNDQIRSELLESKHAIESQLDRTVAFLAYPYGEYDNNVKAITKELGFRGALAMRFGNVMPGADYFEMRRVNVTALADVGDRAKMQFFKCCLRGTAEWYVGFKGLLPWLVRSRRPWEANGPRNDIASKHPIDDA